MPLRIKLGRRRDWALTLGVMALLAAVPLYVLFRNATSFGPTGEPIRSFDGPSDSLERTVLVPTLDTPVPDGKSVIWCSTFQLAWNRLRTDLAKEPIRLANAREVADRLNRAPQSEDDLEPASYYATAGWVKDGIIETIGAKMRRRFPNASVPDFPLSHDGDPLVALAFAYLEASVRYEYQFNDQPDWLHFRDSAGISTAVRAFGIREKDQDVGVGAYRDQVEVLFRKSGEFALDLSKKSKPYQVVLARLQRKETLQNTLRELEARIGDSKPGELSTSAILFVPNMDWRIEHRFAELEGRDKQFQNAALRDCYLGVAWQFVQFRLDREGAIVSSGANVRGFLNGHDDNPNHFYFDQPFLIYLKKRGAQHPFFVMWVDNAELLCRREHWFTTRNPFEVALAHR